jgi:DNA repair protein RecN (Recombination protein N)
MALTELSIRNFAIIKQLELEIDAGLTIVTGETGAGKSIVLDALNLLLGSRAESDMIRHGEDQCEITALFDINGLRNVQSWLEERDLNESSDDQNYCLVRRVVRNNKPTKCYINDQSTTLTSLKELGYMLVDLHGQHEHQSLMRLPEQRKIIDQFAAHEVKLKAMAKIAAAVNRMERELSAVSQNQTDTAGRMELLSFQLNELNEANVTEGEFEELDQEHARLSNSQQLIDGIQSTIDALFHNENKNVSSDLGRSVNRVNELVEFDSNLTSTSELLNSALAQVEEAQSSLESALSKIDQDPQRLSEVELRRDTLINLARKHRCAEDALPQRHQELQEENDRLASVQAKPEKLQKELALFKKQYHDIALDVSEHRQKVAGQLSTMITAQMQDLGMKGGELSIQVEQQITDEVIVSEHGIDRIEFMVSTNYGMPLKPLHKTASGGEMSRISLAIQVITSEKSDTPTLVFDEVDVGVGGKVAQIVGSKLRNLGKHAQVICITHLPQVAAQGNQHIFIDKVSTENETYSTLIKLNDEMRTAEIARMLGGEVITDRTRAHAQEMLAANY